MPRLTIHVQGRDDEAVVAEAVAKIYSIARDDRDLRQIVKEPPAARGKFFDALRKNYPVRRELQNTTVVIDNAAKPLVEKLRGLGFKVEACRA